jgi:exopolysaccharide biosynthesis predicted pyruvyltransferase EpsI
VSWVFAYGAAPQAAARHATEATLAYLDQFERVTTNRLHLCILAALLGKEVDFYANSDFKNEAVYKFTIDDRCPSVRWRGRWEGSGE